MPGKVAVIGAGIAGVAAARTLADVGIDVRIVDKGRGIGGRLATRRVGDDAFDHGAQFFAAKGADFAGRIAAWRQVGVAAPWFDDRFVGLPGMGAPVRALADGLTVSTGSTVVSLTRDGAGWRLGIKEGAAAATDTVFDAVLLAVPSPQAATLLRDTYIALDGLERPTYAPCWALLAAFEAPLDMPDRNRFEAGVFSWIARNDTKLGRRAAGPCYVAHASAAWSRANLELPADQARSRLLEAMAERTGGNLPPLRHAAAHRWRYALVETPLGSTHLWDATNGIGACGDWCLGARVEAAYDSGRALGAAVAAALRAR
jgi:predicted NAD/FAD-dependent oxidoreductase